MANKTMIIGVVGILLGVLLSTTVALAGNLNPNKGPNNPNSQMYTLEQIFTRLSGGGDAVKMTAFTEPNTGPGTGTMHTLDDIYALALPAQVPKTGQTTSYRTGDDGDLQRGVPWPTARFVTGAGVVTDTLTGLIWLENANCAISDRNWATALSDVASLNSTGNMNGNVCGDTSNGGSHQTDWRLPNVREIQSVIDYGTAGPALPNGHPFIGVQPYYYWTSTTRAADDAYVWLLGLYNGRVSLGLKTDSTNNFVWPVRGGQ